MINNMEETQTKTQKHAYETCFKEICALIRSNVTDDNIINLIIDSEIPVNYQSEESIYMIEVASQTGRHKLVEWLLENDAFTKTAPKYAALSNNFNCLQVFQNHGDHLGKWLQYVRNDGVFQKICTNCKPSFQNLVSCFNLHVPYNIKISAITYMLAHAIDINRLRLPASHMLGEIMIINNHYNSDSLIDAIRYKYPIYLIEKILSKASTEDLQKLTIFLISKTIYNHNYSYNYIQQVISAVNKLLISEYID